jgi:serine/threonine protein kinase
VSPEMLKDSYTTTASDFWALGCVFFKLIFGEIAFNGSTELNTFDKILARDFEFPIDA